MKIEFLADGSEDCPLIRMYEYRVGEIEKLRQACRDLADGRITEFVLHDQPWVEPIGGCRFVWRASKKNIGVKLPTPGTEFVLQYADEAWREVEGKLEPFAADDCRGFNWLGWQGDVDVLISHNGQW
jgi:hypothetical protein